MSYMLQKKFIDEIISEFDLSGETLRCYTLDCNPNIKVLTFSQKGWDNCYIGLLIDYQFHVLGLDSPAFVGEPIKSLYITLTNHLPIDTVIMKDNPHSLIDEKEQESIKNKLNQIFPKNETNS